MRSCLKALMLVFLVGCAGGTVVDPVVVPQDKTVVVGFKFNSFKLDVAQKKIIDEAVKQSKEGSKVSIIGYTDSQGSKSYNMVLSKKRAQEVFKYLEVLKVKSSWSAGGESKLLNKDKTKSEHAANRRAELGFIVNLGK